MSHVTINITRNEQDQMVTEIDANVGDDASMKLYLAVLQTMLNDKELVQDYTTAVLAFLDQQKKDNK